MSFEIWSRGSEAACKEIGMPESLSPYEYFIQAHGLVTDYWEQAVDEGFDQQLAEKAKNDAGYFETAFREYDALLQRLHVYWETKTILSSAELREAFDLSVQAWKGLLLAYTIPQNENLPVALRAQALE